MKTIPLCQPWFIPSYADVVRKQVLSTQIGPGPVTKEFAFQLASYVGSKYCLLVTSGTLALSVAAQAAGLKPGEEILVPAYGVVSTINAFISFGLNARLVDIDQTTGCMSPTEMEKRISSKTRAVCFVNFSGYTGRNLLEIVRMCKEKKIVLIEDAACALGQTFKGKRAGTFGDIGIYSFSVPKIISTGQGGAVVTNKYEYFKRASAFIDQGDTNWRKTNLVRGVGNNFRFNDILASFGLAQLKDLHNRITRKEKVFNILNTGLNKWLFRIPGDTPPLHNVIFTKQPNLLITRLRERGIFAARQYRTISQHPPFAQLANSEFCGADFWTNYSVYLPFGLALEPDDADRIIDVIYRSHIPLMQINKKP